MTIPRGPPIDTTERAYCDNCENSLRKRGDWYYRKKKKRGYQPNRKQNHMNVCPFCRESSPKYHNVKVLQCRDCRTYFTNMDIPPYPRDEPKGCPKCDSELTDESTKVISE